MVNASKLPLVSIVTPVFNTAEYLENCINSVLAQTYQNFEYIILDNCSTDGSLEIAIRYAESDDRIRVVQNSDFLDQIENYNESVRQISPSSKYCKMVQADDAIFPECIEKMVSIAESDDSVGMVGGFTLIDFGNRADAYLMGLPYPTKVFDGKEICRRYLLEGLFVTGSPTATMLRSDIVRARKCLYKEDSVIDDTGICMEVLQNSNFGYCHQVLTYTRRYNESKMTVLKQYNLDIVTRYICFRLYGREFLSGSEYRDCRKNVERIFQNAVGEAVLRRLPREYWKFLAIALSEIDESVSGSNKFFWAFKAGFGLALNPKLTLERLKQMRNRPS